MVDRPLQQGDAIVEAVAVEQRQPGLAQGAGSLGLQPLVVGQIVGGPLQLAGLLHRVGDDLGRPPVPLAPHLSGQRLVRHLAQQGVGDLVAGVGALA